MSKPEKPAHNWVQEYDYGNARRERCTHCGKYYSVSSTPGWPLSCTYYTKDFEEMPDPYPNTPPCEPNPKAFTVQAERRRMTQLVLPFPGWGSDA